MTEHAVVHLRTIETGRAKMITNSLLDVSQAQRQMKQNHIGHLTLQL